MIKLDNAHLVFAFPDVHPKANLTIDFQRTLRIPDDDKHYPLPPGLGSFPLHHVDDYSRQVPDLWVEHGGVMFPMYQAEAMWLNFESTHVDDRAAHYPFAIKIAAGKICAVTGKAWNKNLKRKPQNYVIVPIQPWLDGYCVKKGVIRQFVAMPLGAGYTAEEQITDQGEHGGVQIEVFPMKRSVFEKRFPKVQRDLSRYDRLEMPTKGIYFEVGAAAKSLDMGLAPGGKMKQEIYDDPYGLDAWDLTQSSRCFAHIANSLVWRAITGKNPPFPPPTSKEYSNAGLPWFDYYDEGAQAVEGSDILSKLKSVIQMGKKKGDVPLPENEPVKPDHIIELRRGLKKDQVREGRF
ncbi:hypothetical protein ACFLU6_10150 [Acidobacteriota bacterium]